MRWCWGLDSENKPVLRYSEEPDFFSENIRLFGVPQNRLDLVMRRYSFLILFALVLITPFVRRLFLGAATSSPAKPGSLRLNIITAHAESIRREFADAFRAWHLKNYGSDVDIDYTALGSGDIPKVFQDKAETIFPKLGTYQIDLAWGGGDYLFDVQLKAYLQGVQLDPALMAAAFPNPELNGLPLYDLKSKPPKWFGSALASFGITYNRDVLRYLKLPEPKTWTDLSDPRYAGWIVAADPTRSTSAKQAFLAIVEKAMADASAHGESEDIGWARGMGQIRLIAANVRNFTDGSSTVPGIIATGDAAAGMTIDYYGRSEVEAIGHNRLGYVQPFGATVTNPDPIAMIAGAEHAVVAKRFIEFVLSPQGQLLWNKRVGTQYGPKSTNLRRLPIMPSVYADMSDFTDKDDPFKSAGGFNKSDAREKTFGIIGELLETSCMDCLEELRDTRAAILASPRAKELDQKLGLFPFDQKEAIRRGGLFKIATPVEKLALKRAWVEEFRSEYDRLRVEAGLGK
jgi:ABC-type Fe3+ transport system substrate-binding protein